MTLNSASVNAACVDITQPGGLYGNQGSTVCMEDCSVPVCYLDDNFNLHPDDQCLTDCIPAPPTVCGNGIQEGMEECDDGNMNNNDSCSVNCTLLPICGNGALETGEECDDGNTVNGDSCSSTCRNEICESANVPQGPFGDLESSQLACIQACGTPSCYIDQDPVFYTDAACTQQCSPPTPPVCGNGTIEIGEECDDGNTTGGDTCDSNCKNEPVCGNGTVESGEECDDGNIIDFDGCSSNCLAETCDDATIPGGIFGNQGTQVCMAACQTPSCYVNEAGELHTDTGCTRSCEIEPDLPVKPILECVLFDPDEQDLNIAYTAYFGYLNENTINVTIPIGSNNFFHYQGQGGLSLGQPTVFEPGRTDFYPNAEFNVGFDGSNLVWTLTDPSGSTRTATASNNPAQRCSPICSNNVREAGEECDDGNTNNGDGCDSSCQLEPFCGDGNIDSGEECDDGNTNNGDGCDAQCNLELTCDGSELIINGSFETPIVSDPENWDIYPNGTSNLGWTVEWESSQTNHGGQNRPSDAQLEYQRNLSGWNADDGDQYAELDSDWDGPGGTLGSEPSSIRIYQDLETIAGESYTIDFAFAARPGTTDADNSLAIRWNGSLEDTVTASNTSSSILWTSYRYNFVANSATTRIEFADTGNPDSIGTFIDNVSVSCGNTAASCGNGILEPQVEECDDGNSIDNDGCTACTIDPVCGDGIVETGEECDDGNILAGDGCSATCENEECISLDFNNLNTGEILSNQLPGINISAENNSSGHPDAAIIFDSSNPSGGDHDLATPGSGSGNNSSLEKIIIIAEDIDDNNNDGFVDDPDDEGYGGKIFFDFINPVRVESLTLIDIENSSSYVKGLDSSNNELFNINAADQGDNSVQTINTNQTTVTTNRLEIGLDSSGAVDNLRYCYVAPICGNSNVEAGESCDDGNTSNGDGCDSQCQIEAFCGDGNIDPGEECDDGNQDDNDNCSNTCTTNHHCPNGIVSYWPFDDQNNPGDDFLGLNDGTLNGPNWTRNGLANAALDFDGNNDYLDVGNFNISGDEMTISAWFYADRFGTDPRVISKASSTSLNDHDWMFGFDDYNSSYARILFRLKTDNNSTLELRGNYVPRYEWCYITASYDGSNMKIYLNGQEVASRSQSGNIANSSKDVWIGANPTNASHRPFNGRLDEIAIFDRALSQSEIQDIFEKGVDEIGVCDEASSDDDDDDD